MWHVLEHVHELHKRLEQVANLLQKEGVLIIAVPNPESWDASHYQDYWAAYDVPRHLYHFTPAVLKNLICSFGFTHLESQPMPFDSFYVSMLSEKYKHSKLQLIKAFLKGLKSNLITGCKAEKYSSVIYIFRKAGPILNYNGIYLFHVKPNVEPSPKVEDTVILPFSLSMIFLTIVNPIPVLSH